MIKKRGMVHPGGRLRTRREKAQYLERLFRVRNILRDVFTTDEAVAQWLCEPDTALAMMTPMEALETVLGAAAVENLARATVHGVPLATSATAHKAKKLSPAQLGRLAAKLQGAAPAQAKKIKKKIVGSFYSRPALRRTTELKKEETSKELSAAGRRERSFLQSVRIADPSFARPLQGKLRPIVDS